MSRKIRVGVLFGGRSGEHEVSLVSAEHIIRALDKSKYEVIPIGISKKGTWLTQNNPLNKLKQDQLKELKFEKIITPDPTKKSLVIVNSKYFTTQNKKLTFTKQLDVVIPALHGTYGEDGTVQGLLELANLPYVGANVLASAIGMDKVIQKKLFQQANLPTPDYTYFLTKDFKKNPNLTIKIATQLKFPLFVKPANLGSSVGITKVYNKQALLPAIKYAAQYDRKIIIEKAIINPHEIEVAVLGNDNPRASIPGEIIASSEFYDYDAKYVDGLSETIIPAKLKKTITAKIRAMAITAFKIIDCSGMARVDFLITAKDQIYLSELNTIPGFTTISMYPKLWAASGLPYPKLLDTLIKLALERHREKSRLSTTYQPKKKWYK